MANLKEEFRSNIINFPSSETPPFLQSSLRGHSYLPLPRAAKDDNRWSTAYCFKVVEFGESSVLCSSSAVS